VRSWELEGTRYWRTYQSVKGKGKREEMERDKLVHERMYLGIAMTR
jgi:hypothetical protein